MKSRKASKRGRNVQVMRSVYERCSDLKDEAAFYNKDPLLTLLREFYGPDARGGLKVLEVASGC